MVTRNLRIVVLVVAVGFLAESAQAQVQRRAPRQPGYTTGGTISPYTQLFGNQQEGINNYLLEVRPRLQTQRQLSQLRQQTFQGGIQQQQFIAQQSMAIQQTLENTLQMTSRSGSGRIPATAGRFLDTRQFFGGASSQTGITPRSFNLRPRNNASGGGAGGNQGFNMRR